MYIFRKQSVSVWKKHLDEFLRVESDYWKKSRQQVIVGKLLYLKKRLLLLLGRSRRREESMMWGKRGWVLPEVKGLGEELSLGTGKILRTRCPKFKYFLCIHMIPSQTPKYSLLLPKECHPVHVLGGPAFPGPPPRLRQETLISLSQSSSL